MRVSIVDVGNSKGIRIPQAVLRQVSFGDEVEMEVAGGRITLRRIVDPGIVPEMSAVQELDDPTIQRVLRRLKEIDLITSLIGAEETVKDAIYRNLSDRVRAYISSKVAKLEAGDARDLIIEQSRDVVSEAIMTTQNE